MFLLNNDSWEIKTTEKKGRGVFAKKDIPAGTIIGDYLGKLIHDDTDSPYDEKDGLYTMYYTDDVSVVPDPGEAGIHLINNSCAPNTFLYSYQGHTLYFALRKIFAGEEITVSYMLSPIDDDCSPCTDTCHCGSAVCTGSMHSNKERYDAWVDFDDNMTNDVKLPPITLGEMLSQLPSYPPNIPDDDFYPLFGSTHAKQHKLPNHAIPSKKELRQLIRETGQQLHFTNLHIILIGITDTLLICKSEL